MKREANFTMQFRHWLMANPRLSAAYELKQTTGGSIPFSALQEHQAEALMAVKRGKTGFLYKAPDDSRGTKPFDMFYLRGGFAYVVVKFPGEFSIIDIDTWLLEQARSKRKSLTKERARDISTNTVKV